MIPKIQIAFNGWESNINLKKVTDAIVDYEKIQTETSIDFTGVVQPLKTQDLALKPIETRAWQWWMIHTKEDIEINVGDVIVYDGTRCEVMNKNNYKLNGYFEYHIVEKFL